MCCTNITILSLRKKKKGSNTSSLCNTGISLLGLSLCVFERIRELERGGSCKMICNVCIVVIKFEDLGTWGLGGLGVR